MPRRSAALPAAPESAPDRLYATVTDLSQNVRVLTDLVDQLREDVTWLTRNGLPHQPLHVILHHVPRDLGSNDKTSFQVSLAGLAQNDPTAGLSDEQRETVTDQIVERLADYLGEIAQEQLNALLSGMDHAHREVMKAIRSPESSKSGGEAVAETASNRRRRTPDRLSETAAQFPPADPPPGQLF